MDISKNTNRDHGSNRPLRFITCGNVDDGKSTLIGRLLWDSNAVKTDQKSAIPQTITTPQGEETHPDYAHLLDGLQAEREQGITIDVAYRYFSTSRRSFIVADTPGHEQYTRNMATGASTADVAILLIDAQTGVGEQTHRHALIAHMMGIDHLVAVINKMDLVNYSETSFRDIVTRLENILAPLEIAKIDFIPTVAVSGENVVYPGSYRLSWYRGPTLLNILETATPEPVYSRPFRMSVQRVSRPHEKFRGFQGTIAGGNVRVGQEIVVLPSRQKAEIKSICTFDGDKTDASTGDAVTLVLDRKIDIARGDIIADPDHPPSCGQLLSTTLIILDDGGLDPTKRYLLKSQSKQQYVHVSPSNQFNLNTGQWDDNDSKYTKLEVNTIIKAGLSMDEPVIYDPYEMNRSLGAFILIDPMNYATVAGGMFVGAAQEPVFKPEISSDNFVRLTMPEDLAQEILLSETCNSRRSEISIELAPKRNMPIADRSSTEPELIAP